MYILFLILALIFLILSLNFKLVTVYKDMEFTFELYFMNIKISVGKKKKNKESQKADNKEGNKQEFNLNTLKKYIEIVNELFSDIKNLFRYFKRKIKADVFEIDLTFGMNDAAETGIATGLIWATIGTLYPIIDTVIEVNEPVINVNPKFNCEYFNMEYKGVYKLRLFHIIYIGINSLKLYFKCLKRIKKYGGA